MRLPTLKIGILGLGQIGGSIAARLSASESSPQVIGFDLRPELMRAAQEKRIVAGIVTSETELVESSELVLVALPVANIIAFLRRQQESLRRKVAVTDTGSLKYAIMEIANDLGMSNFIGGHPLAGTEKQGVASWNGKLFENANYFLANSNCADSGAVGIVTELVSALGAKAVPVDPGRHDRIFAYTSNLPHLLAFSLSQLFLGISDGDADTALFRCSSFLGATRVADSDPEMVSQMLWHNRDNLSVSLAALLERLTAAKAALNDGDEKRFRRLFELP